MSKTILALGELLVDFSPLGANDQDWPSLQALPGGAPSNFLATCKVLGNQTSFIGAVGEDLWGHKLVECLQKHGINTNGINFVEAFTTLAFVLLDEQGDRDFAFSRRPGADTCLSLNESQKEQLKHCAVFHFGTLSMTADPARSATKEALSIAKNSGSWVSFDPNYRAPLWTSEESAREAMIWAYQQVDSMKIGMDELRILLPKIDDLEKAVEHIFANSSIQLLCVTNGSEGAYFYTRHTRGFVPAFQHDEVIDTTGAGDIFYGAIIGQLVRQEDFPNVVAQLPKYLLTKIIQKASMFASLSTKRRGGISSIPSLNDVDLALQGLLGKN